MQDGAGYCYYYYYYYYDFYDYCYSALSLSDVFSVAHHP